MVRMFYSLAVASLFLPTATKAQGLVTSVQVKIYVGEEDKHAVGQVELEAKYARTVLLEKEGIGAGKPWTDNQLADTVEEKVEDGPRIKDGEPLKLEAELSDTRGPGKFNNCIMKFVVRLTTDQGKVYVGETEYLCFDVENGGKCKGGGVGQPRRKFDITLRPE